MKLKNSDFMIKNLSVNAQNEQLKSKISLNSSPFNINFDKKNNIKIETKGNIDADSHISEFDIDILAKYPNVTA